jgi:hypothetical protein
METWADAKSRVETKVMHLIVDILMGLLLLDFADYELNNLQWIGQWTQYNQ